MAVKVVSYEQEKDLTGEHIRIFLKSDFRNAGFTLYVTETAPGYIKGFDVERLDMKIETCDIDYVIIQETGGLDIERFYTKEKEWEQHLIREHFSAANDNKPIQTMEPIETGDQQAQKYTFRLSKAGGDRKGRG